MIKNSNYPCWLNAFIIAVAFCHHLTLASTDSCWTNDAECLVHGTLFKSVISESEADVLPMDIDCTTTQDDVSTSAMPAVVSSPPDYLMKRFERAYGLTLNGCHKGLKWITFGFEFMPNCDKITELTVERFHADALYSLQCPHATFMQIEVLRFERNEIAAITAAALFNLSLLRELYFEFNWLRHVESNSFDNLPFIERIHFENEPLLAIKDALLFQRTKVADLRLNGLKYVISSLFENLPETILNLTVTNTMISSTGDDEAAATVNHDVGTYLNVHNPRKLRNITIIDCELRSFKLNDDHGSVLFLNLSNNKLMDFELLESDKNATRSKLQILDLSYNYLQSLPSNFFHSSRFNCLEILNLQGNLIKQLPLLRLLNAFPAMKFLDLASNKLENLVDTNVQAENNAFYEVRIRIDENPWNCKWLLDFAHTHPDKFGIFQYDKFLSQINVNGLACVPENASYEKVFIVATNNTKSPNKLGFNEANEEYLNISTFTLIYGSPWDIKRNQRAEALIIVFMLPVGIAVLFLLLYLWIYCQKVFHLSFYQKCKFFKRRGRANTRGANRFDIVRQLPPNATVSAVNNNEGYELPLNGCATICNCTHNTGNDCNNTSDLTNHRCRKTHHITYVPLPDERAQQIYEEIIDSHKNRPNETLSHSTTDTLHPVYDHLTFE